MIPSGAVGRLVGADATDPEHVPVGRVRHVFMDEYVPVPAWVGIQQTDDGEVLVPLDGADLDEAGLHVAVTRDQINHVPAGPADAAPTEERRRALYDHYGMGVSYSVQDDADGAAPQP